MIYRLGEFEIDPANFALTANGEPVAVEPLVFDLIVCLIEHRDRLLTRDELFDKLWAGKVVSDTSLSNHIKSARKALGDDGQKQQVIKTVHGRGYRFVAEVEEIDSDGAAKEQSPPQSQPPGPATKLSSRMKLAYAAAVVALAIVGSRMLYPVHDVDIESVAVLPLKNLSNDPEQAYFVEGMQDALISRLSRATDLRVISKTSTMRYGYTQKSMPEIAGELDVDALVEGSVLRDGDRVRITAQLVLGSSDEHVWSGSYDREAEHVLALINEISMAIAGEIEAAVESQEVEQQSQVRTVSVRAHELVLRGDHHFDRFEFEESLQYYRQAVELDAGFATAHAGVAGCYIVMAIFNQRPFAEVIPMAREAALRAIDLDSNSAGGHSGLGFIQLYFDRDWESARINLSRALELSPNDARTRHAYADYLMVMGDLEGSLKQVEIGLLYDPLSPLASSVVNFHRLLARRYDEVIEAGRQALASDQDSIVNLGVYQEALWLKGMREEALAAFKHGWGSDERLLSAMEDGYAAAGHTGAIHALADALAARVPRYDDYVLLAKLYALADEPASAIAWLERAFEARQPQILHVKAMPAFDGLRSNAEFQKLLRRIGLPDLT